MAGNIGPTLLDTLAQKRDADALPQVWVLELSSFQLDGVTRLRAERRRGAEPDAGPPRLARHMAAYAAAKSRVFGRPAHVLNRDDPLVMKMLPQPCGSRGGKNEQRDYVTFGADLPQRPGDFGIEVVNGMAWLVRAPEADETEQARKDEEEEIHLQRLMPADALRIRGRHNAVNALAALALAGAVGCPLGPMLYGLREYRGEPHRVEPVGIVDERRVLRRQQGHQRRRHGRRAAGPGRRAQAGRDPRRRRQGPGLRAAGRAGGAPCARAVVLIGRDAPQIRAVLEPPACRCWTPGLDGAGGGARGRSAPMRAMPC